MEEQGIWPHWIGIAVHRDRETRDLTITVAGEQRRATWKKGIGIYFAGPSVGQGDSVEIEGTPHEVLDLKRMQLEREPVTLILRARQLR